MKYRRILVASTGRAGSTLLMKILASHSEIVVRSLFPYETRASQYYYLANQKKVKMIDFAPITWNNTEYRPFQANDRQSTLWSQQQTTPNNQQSDHFSEAYYSFVSELENKPLAKCFAEKLIGLSLVKPMIDSFSETKVVFLQRDPRDTFFSIKSFNKKRGYLSFGEQQGEHALFANIIGFYKHCQRLRKTLNQENYINIKYENLVTEKMATISQLFKKLDMDNSERQVLAAIEYAFAESPESLNHKTSNNVSASMSRWKLEADEPVLEIFASFKKELELMNYLQ